MGLVVRQRFTIIPSRCSQSDLLKNVNHSLPYLLLLALLYAAIPAPESDAQVRRSDPVIRVGNERLPAPALQTISAINVRGGDLRDVLRGIGADAGLNLVVDDEISRQVTLSLENIEALEAVLYLAEEYDLTVIQTGTVFRVRLPDPLAPEPLRISFDGEKLSVDVSDADVTEFAQRVTEVSGVNVITGIGVSGRISGFLQNADFDDGLKAVVENNGYALATQSGIYVIEQGYAPLDEPEPRRRSSMGVEMDHFGYVSLDLTNADVARVVREIAELAGSGVILYTLPEGARVSVRAAGLTQAEALRAVLHGTGTSFRYESGLLVIGNAEQDGIEATRLLPLGYIRVAGLEELLPPRLTQDLTITVVNEQNALLVTGPNDRIAAVESFLAEVDVPAPQILIEALVVDFLDTNVSELGITFGRGLLLGRDSSGTRLPTGYVLDGLGDGRYEASGDGRDANNIIAQAEDFIGISNIGRLPADFFYRIRALEQEGKVEVRSRPQISTLNGSEASISIGTTQYFILRSTTPIAGPNQVVTQESERFEQIEANVSLTVTPFVSPSGEITADIQPVFSTPVGQLTAGEPPTISTREITSTVRLRDGETIILGGLIEERDIINDNKVPILGDIPILGRLFRSRSRSKRRSELVIYLTPHVFYGDSRDDEKWRNLVERLGLENAVEAGLIEEVESTEHRPGDDW